MHPADINAALIKRGLNQTRIAEQVGVTRAAVSATVLGVGASRRIADAIAEAVGMTVDQLWPGRYSGEFTATGRRRRRAA